MWLALALVSAEALAWCESDTPLEYRVAKDDETPVPPGYPLEAMTAAFAEREENAPCAGLGSLYVGSARTRRPCTTTTGAAGAALAAVAGALASLDAERA